jgi:hypothetical protein
MNRTLQTLDTINPDLLHMQSLVLSALDCLISSVGECEQK